MNRSTKIWMTLVSVFLALAVVLLVPVAAGADMVVGWGDQKTPGCALTNLTKIAAGGGNNLALKADGSIVGWGWDDSDQAMSPVGSDFVAIAAGYKHSLALKADGSIVGWGYNDYGQATPPAGTDFVAIAAGGFHSLALKDDGSIVGWGAGGPDQTGWPHYGQSIPPAGTDFDAIAAGGYHSLALKTDNSFFDDPFHTRRSSNKIGDFVNWPVDSFHGMSKPPQFWVLP